VTDLPDLTHLPDLPITWFCPQCDADHDTKETFTEIYVCERKVRKMISDASTFAMREAFRVAKAVLAGGDIEAAIADARLPDQIAEALVADLKLKMALARAARESA